MVWGLGFPGLRKGTGKEEEEIILIELMTSDRKLQASREGSK